MKLVVLLSILVVARGRSLNEQQIGSTQADDSEVYKCQYGGAEYNEGDNLPTRHMCLSCKCTREFLEPSNRYCDVIECPNTDKLDLGCTPVYNDTECCPVSWDCDKPLQLISQCKCEERYFKHYEAKACLPVYEEGCNCPIRFNCSTPEKTINNTVCKYKNHTYEIGEDIVTSNPCEICSCQQSYYNKGAEIDCIFVECPSDFGLPSDDNCYDVYEENRCCPTSKCITDEVTERTESTCEYGGKTYRLGERIYPEEDPCMICTCTEDWSGVHGNSCRKHECMLQRKLRRLEQRCIPIYHEATCCPIEIYCGSPEEGFRNTTIPLANSTDIESGMSCEFKGSHYKLGQTLDINHPTHCVTCTCSTPPDFTCIHKKCPGPPNGDYENCSPTYSSTECCPTYECEKRSFSPVQIPECTPVVCPVGCSEVTVHNSCPFCMCNDILCSPPKCSTGCEVQKDVPPGQCPGCECSHFTVTPICSPVKCPENCYEAINPGGCPMCVCGPVCYPPKCDSGCEIERDVEEGECPRCFCPNKDTSIQCSPVQCPAGCRESVGESGCPSCDCGPMCSPPKCEEGCYVDPSPTGPCPGCICGDKDPAPYVQCAPVKCGPLCHEAYYEAGCPSCICDPLCSPLQCEAGCRLEFNPATGPCPECVCDKKETKCPKITCGTMCREVMGSDGCPTCYCDPLCSPPKCDGNCHLEYDRSAGPCPSCVCLEKK
ncbi:hypothetical protein X975_27156, partial [Stegodyphus mimosarum]